MHAPPAAARGARVAALALTARVASLARQVVFVGSGRAPTRLRRQAAPLVPGGVARFEQEVELAFSRGAAAPWEVHIALQRPDSASAPGTVRTHGDAVLNIAAFAPGRRHARTLPLESSGGATLRVTVELQELEAAASGGNAAAADQPDVPSQLAPRARAPASDAASSGDDASGEGSGTPRFRGLFGRRPAGAPSTGANATAAPAEQSAEDAPARPRSAASEARATSRASSPEPAAAASKPAWWQWRRSAPSTAHGAVDSDNTADDVPSSPPPAALSSARQLLHKPRGRHVRSASAPAEAMAAPRDALLAPLPADDPAEAAASAERLFQKQLADALESSAALASGRHVPEAVKLRRNNGASAASPSQAPVTVSPFRVSRTSADGGEWLQLELTPPAEADGEAAAAPVRAEVFFGSLDQRSADAGGAGACACLAVALAAWLQAHPERLPTAGGGALLDGLVRGGSAAWRALRADPATAARFGPDGHLDIATALSAQTDVAAAPGGSFVAFLRPPGCPPGTCAPLDALLSAAPCLGDCLAAAARAAPCVAVLSLLDHHVALRFESDGAVVLADTLGERLFEGNSHAYVLRFDAAADADADAGGARALARLLSECVAAPRLRALGAALAAAGAAGADADTGDVASPERLCALLQVDLLLLCPAAAA
jgi:hypothetical protein